MIAVLALLAAAAPAPSAQPPRPTPTPIAISRSTAAPPRGKSLAEVARGIKLRLPPGESRVITDEKLKSLSSGVELTTGSAPAPSAGPPTDLAAADAEAARRKEEWQARFFSAQQEARDLEAEEARLTQEVARLEREFYSRDDPYQRDSVIKPAWDEAVARLRDVQQRLPEARRAPDEIANAARRDGALPGWFRESPPPTPAPGGPGAGARE